MYVCCMWLICKLLQKTNIYYIDVMDSLCISDIILNPDFLLQSWLKLSNNKHIVTTIHTHTHLTALFSGTTQVSRYQKGKTNLDLIEARDSEWQWHQLGHMQVCNSLQTDNHDSNPPLSFLQAGCTSCRPTNSVKALKTTIH